MLSSAKNRFEQLRHHANLAADDALLELMALAEPELAREAVHMLFERENEGGLSGIIRAYHNMAPEVQRIVVDGVDVLSPALRLSVSGRDAQTCKNAIGIITAGKNHRLAYLLSPCLTHGTPSVRDAAATALISLIEQQFERETLVRQEMQTASRTAEPAWEECHAAIQSIEEDRRHLTTTLERSLENFHVHRRTDLLHAGLRLAGNMTQSFWAKASEPTTKLGRAVSEFLQTSRDPLTAETVYQAMVHSTLRTSVVRMLEQCRNQQFLEALAAEHRLLRIPKIRKAFASIRKLGGLDNGSDLILKMPPATAAGMVTVLMATSVPQSTKVATLLRCLTGGQRPLQQAALWAMLTIDEASVSNTLRTVLRWDKPDLSPIALTELMRRHPENLDALMVGQLRSRTPRVREVAEERVAAVSFERYWDRFDQLDEATRAGATRAMAKLTRDLPRKLRAKLSSAQSKERVRAIQVIRILGLTKEMQEHLYRLCHDSDPIVRSAAVATISDVRTLTAERIARISLGDTDARVQANAVESLELFNNPDHRDQIKTLLTSDNNRVRANAVKALLQTNAKEAARALLQMLKHESHLHRISALWVIERLGLASITDLVSKISESDPNPAVRTRASRIREGLHRQRAPAESTS